MSPQTQFWIYFVISAVLASGALLSGYWTKYAWDEWGKLTASSSGKISGKILDEEKPYLINIGGNFLDVSANDLKKGINIGQWLSEAFTFGDKKIDLPIKIYEENNRLLFDVSIENEGKPVFTIIANEFVFNPDGEFDRNFNINGVEVVDKNLVPRIQIYLEDGNKIYIGGTNKYDENFVVFTHKGIGTRKANDQLAETIKPLFKYPSFKYPEAVIKDNLPDFSIIDARISEAQKREPKINEFSKLSNARLSSKALELAVSVDKLQKKYDSKLNTKQPKRNNELLEENHKRLLVEYDSLFKDDVLAVIQVTHSRLSSEKSEELEDPIIIEATAQNYHQFREYISSSLRKAANLLPKDQNITKTK